MYTVFYYLLRFLLSLRYLISVHGDIQGVSRKGGLICPNHPAEIDPVIIMTILWRQCRPRPVVLEDFYYMPGLHWLFKRLRAIPMPNIEAGLSAFKRRRIQHALTEITESVEKGESILLYPSGRLWRDNKESVGGASALHTILSQAPNIPVTLIRTRGLWGSSFSWAFHGRRPDIFRMLLHGAKAIFINAVFLVPKRHISITISADEEDIPRNAERRELNEWLENWYNKPGAEECTVIPYNRWTGKAPEITSLEYDAQHDTTAISEEVVTSVCTEIARLRNIPTDDISADMNVRRDVGLDSLEMAEILDWLERKYGVIDIELSEIKTVGDIMSVADSGVPQNGMTEKDMTTPGEWVKKRIIWEKPQGKTLQECFVKTCVRTPNLPACADDISGVLTYRRMLLGALAFAHILQKKDESHIGIMLPSSVAADICIMAVLLAGKIPVMVNWTVGSVNLKHVVESTGVKTILTSMRFLDKIDNEGLLDIEEAYLFLEDVRKTHVTLSTKLRALWLSHQSSKSILKKMNVQAEEEDTAIVFFTSGSEAQPKGVPLTHKNILTNIHDVSEKIHLENDDVICAILPPFHSFGMTATTLLPLVLGIRVAHYANPTEARRIVNCSEKWQATTIAGTPTFLNAIFHAATDTQLNKIRLAVAGAEKAPQELYEYVAKHFPHITFREGYGITECSPVVCACGPDDPAIGVGPPLHHVEIAIIHHETHEPCGQDERGLILVRGPSVFNGYLDTELASPFITHEGREWYNTGDLGYIEEHGHLVISGRLKRFIKIAAEMVSLPAIEAALTEKWPATDDGPQLAVSAYEPENGRPIIAVFTVNDIDRETVNAHLKDKGFGNIVRVDKVISCDELPVLGTGKTDYKVLQKRLKNEQEGK